MRQHDVRQHDALGVTTSYENSASFVDTLLKSVSALHCVMRYLGHYNIYLKSTVEWVKQAIALTAAAGTDKMGP